jgi:hypothetical protein
MTIQKAPLSGFDIFIDSCAGASIFKERSYLANMRILPKEAHVSIQGVNGDKIIVTQAGEFLGIPIYYDERVVTNLLCMYDVLQLAQDGSLNKNSLDQTQSLTFHLPNVHKDLGPLTFSASSAQKLFKMRPCGSAKYLADISQFVAHTRNSVFHSSIATTTNNESKITKGQLIKARLAREFEDTIGMSPRDLKTMLKEGGITTTPFWTEDVDQCHRTYGPSVRSLRGKTVSPVQRCVRKTQTVPRILFKTITLHVDLLFVDELPFLVSISDPIGLSMVTKVGARSTEDLTDALSGQIALYRLNGHAVDCVTTDEEAGILSFEATLASMGIRMLKVGKGQHDHQVERRIRVIKERARAIKSGLPYQLNTQMVLFLVYTAVLNVNLVPQYSKGIRTSPRQLYDGRLLDYDHFSRAPYGTYVQAAVIPDDTRKNSMDERTYAGLTMLPAFDTNQPKSFRILSLETFKMATRSKFTVMPITPALIDVINDKVASERLFEKACHKAKREGKPIPIRGEINWRRKSLSGRDVEKYDNDDYLRYDPQDAPKNPIPDDNVQSQESELIDPPANPPVITSEPPTQVEDAIQESVIVQSEDPTDVALKDHEDPPDPSDEDDEDPAPDKIEYPEIYSEPSGIPGYQNPITKEPRRSLIPVIPEARRSTRNAPRPDYNKVSKMGFQASYLSTSSTGYNQYLVGAIMVLANISVKQASTTKIGREAITKEMQQMIDTNSWRGISEDECKTLQEQSTPATVIGSHMFCKEKRSGEFKARLVARGDQQIGELYSDNETSSPTVRTETVFLVASIAACELRTVRTLDVKGAYLHQTVNEDIIMRLDPILTQILIQLDPGYAKFKTTRGIIQVKLLKAIYGLVESARLLYNRIRDTLEKLGFIMNPKDLCCFNRETSEGQVTVIFHVDDLMISSIHEPHLDTLEDNLGQVFHDKDGKSSIKRNAGLIHDYLGMTFDFSTPSKVIIDMRKYIDEILAAHPVDIRHSIHTPAREDLFNVEYIPPNDEVLSPIQSKVFLSATMKLMFLVKRGRPDALTPVAFLSTRANKPTVGDTSKLQRVIQYLANTQDLLLTLEASSLTSMICSVDSSYGVHSMGKSHTGVAITLGKGTVSALSSKQKIVAKSSCEAELIGISDGLSPIIWVRDFMICQGYKMGPAALLQDNQATIKLAEKGRPGTIKTRHIHIRYFFITDRISDGEIVVDYCPTDETVSDMLTKPLQGSKFIYLRSILLNLKT